MLSSNNPGAVAVGVRCVPTVPSPNAPLGVVPQQYAVPLSTTPHACEFPTAMLVNESAPSTRVGVRRSVLVPSPSCPPELSPQQYAAPSVVSPHVTPSTLETARV